MEESLSSSKNNLETVRKRFQSPSSPRKLKALDVLNEDGALTR